MEPEDAPSKGEEPESCFEDNKAVLASIGAVSLILGSPLAINILWNLQERSQIQYQSRTSRIMPWQLAVVQHDTMAKGE